MARVTSNVNAQMNKIDKMIENILSTVVQETARELVERVSNPVRLGFGKSPTWTGQFIDGWRVGVNSPDLSRQSQYDYYAATRHRLEPPFPIFPRKSSYIGKNVGMVMTAKLGDTIHITNNTIYIEDSGGVLNRFSAADIDNKGTRTAPNGVTGPALEASLERINMRITRAIGLQAKRGLL